MTRPVLILDGAPRVACSVARSLSRQGIVVDMARFAASGARPIRSRAIRKRFTLPSDPSAFLPALRRVVDAYRHDMLIPCTDAALAAIAPHYETLCDRIHAGCPPPEVVRRVLDKNITMEFAARCGVRVPRQYGIPFLADLESARKEIVFPVVSKPANKELERAYKVRYFGSFEELRACFDEDPEFGSRYIVQEYCPGYGVGIETLLWKGEPIAMFQHRRIKELPFTGGASVVAASEKVDPKLAGQAIALLRELEWEGPAMVEFRYDPNSGSPVLMEVNGRYWGSLPLSCQAGIDFPFYSWQLVHDQKPSPPASYKSGLRMRWLAGDVFRLSGVARQWKSGSVGLWFLFCEMIRFFFDFRPGLRNAIWSFSDPQPAIDEIVPFFTGRIPRALRDEVRLYQTFGFQVGFCHTALGGLRRLGFRKDGVKAFPARPRSILFVCSGNILRSPIAAQLLRCHLGQKGIQDISIDSAGVYADPDRLADPRGIAAARKLGISLDSHRAKLLTSETVNNSDVVFVMDRLNEASFLAAYPRATSKTYLLGAWTDKDEPASALEIADPYSGTAADVERCYQIIEKRIHVLADSLSITKDHAV